MFAELRSCPGAYTFWTARTVIFLSWTAFGQLGIGNCYPFGQVGQYFKKK